MIQNLLKKTYYFLIEAKGTCETNLIPIHRKLDTILAILNEQNPALSNVYDLLPNFPLNCFEDFKNFCNELKKMKCGNNLYVKIMYIISLLRGVNHS